MQRMEATAYWQKKREEFHRLAQPSGEGLQLMKIETQGHTNSEENS